MSAGVFTIGRYQASYDPTRIHPIRVQPETYALSAGTATLGVVNNPISARVSAGKRSKGLIARNITLRLGNGAALPGYKENGITRVPICTVADFNALQVGNPLVYLGVSWDIIGKSDEIAK